MAKKHVDYKDCVEETLKAFVENRVLLVSKGKQGPPNAMAIGWGTVGLIWRKPMFIVLVRPSRFTYKLIEESGDFTVNIAPAQMKEVVQFCGTVSGRDYNKFEEKKLTPISSSKVNAPIIKECILHYECQITYKNDLVPPELAESIKPAFYPKGDFHRIYFGEILACQKEV
jgi:flavin reductase (DIM6/NTAB) family NADH-FMN oxidoreductase RutF